MNTLLIDSAALVGLGLLALTERGHAETPAPHAPASAPSFESATALGPHPPDDPRSERARAEVEHGATKGGLSGRLSLGVLYANTRTNMVASAGGGLVHFGNGSLESLDGSPSPVDGAIPIVNLHLQYDFASTGTEILFGTWNHGEGTQFDYLVEGGLGQKIGSTGKISLVYLFGFPVKVWSDPYVVGASRSETNRNSQGVALAWEGILGTALEADYSFRSVSIAKESSGSFLGLGPGDASLLERGGFVHQIEVSQTFTFARAHRFTPTFTYRREASDGDAMSANTLDWKLRYAFGTRTLAAILEGGVGRSVHDRSNPVFGKTQADMRYMASATLIFRQPFGWAPFAYRGWSLLATVRYGNNISNIDFYSTGYLAAGGGLAVEF